jgi:hypothetical protein
MAERRVGAGGEDGRGPASFSRKPPMADRIHTAIKRMKAAEL